MARRFSARRLGGAAVAALIVLSGCVGSPERSATAPAAAAATAADPELVSVAEAMQKTVLEGAVAGAALGGTITLGGSRQSRSRGISIGAGLGATAGSYVALMQRRYILRERRLNAIRDDLNENSAEIAATIAVMRRVLAQQEFELATARASVAAGTLPESAVAEEVAQASANLAQMQRAVDGAAGRQAEFAEARGLVATGSGGSAIDPELAALSSQIAEMRAIAGDLAADL